jgi:hypothetical protein
MFASPLRCRLDLVMRERPAVLTQTGGLQSTLFLLLLLSANNWTQLTVALVARNALAVQLAGVRVV